MPSLLTLPDELIILVCQNLTIPALFSLRIVHPHLASLIINKSTSISGNVACNTFQDADLLLRAPTPQRQDFEWLKNLVLKYNAAILVDRFRIGSDRVFMEPRWIPAESELGNVLRARVENGWRVLKQLSSLLKKVEVIASKPALAQTKTSASLHIARRIILRKGKAGLFGREKELHDAQLSIQQYLETLPMQTAEDFQITLNMLLLALRTHHDPIPVHLRSLRGKYRNAAAPAEFDFDFATGTFIEKYSSWVNWVILQMSPYDFFLQWLPGSDARPEFVRSIILRRWEETERVTQQRDLAILVRDTIEERGLKTISWMNTANDECEKYLAWENGLSRFHSGEPLPREWMKDIAFIIDLRANDNSVS
jgi:hypothetical protein